ncbi:MAG: actin-binding WH2 domain-containing protein [Leptolyngbyaceae cyanobacterium SL_5_9]|nr:actin-binding WH2 domain-containing protein [Leptolyngbyaceae cyanobacterium SL_5_9]NJO76235.1 actin-binding WH2 domain-containing protein [Leptolyngbyaceae cyanobacterium RM1_406_9]
MKYFAVLITLLRDRTLFLEEIRQGIKIESKIVSLLISSSIFFAVYGAIIGANSSLPQVISSAVKLPALYLITLIICLPTLFFFDILFGSTLAFNQYAALILTTVSVISVLLFSFAPVTLFFLVSIRDYEFFLLLNIAIFALTGLIGVKLFYQGMQFVTEANYKTFKSREPLVKLDKTEDTPEDFVPVKDAIPVEDKSQKMRTKLLQFWLFLYALVGSQLGWTLRPFFGAPGEPFQLFRSEIESNFYQQVIRMIFTVLGFQ